MKYEITMPKLGLTMTSGIVDGFNVKVGDFVKKGDEVVTIETDKIAAGIEALEDGYVIAVLAVEGQEYPVTEVLCVISDNKDDIYEQNNMPQKKTEVIAEEKQSAKIEIIKGEPLKGKDSSGRIFITPIARLIAKENNIDISLLGRKHCIDRLVKKDIEDVIVNKSTINNFIPANPVSQGEVRVSKMTGTRKVIAERLTYSKKNIPHAYFNVEVNCDKLMEIRKQMQPSVLKNTGLKLTINDFVIKAVLNALEDYKELNCNVSKDTVSIFDDINIGIAMNVDSGLIVPNIKRANDLSITDIKKQVNILAEKAKKGTLALEDITGGTFTISNLGAYKVKEFGAIINPPETAMLAVSSISKSPYVVDDNLVIANTMIINISVDHRVIDGVLACQFLNSVKYHLENPFMLLS